MTSAPHVFLSHASEDEAIALRLGKDFLAKGIDTFLDKWDISSGQSLRRRIEEGLGGCTHFVVLLTPQSICKPWVNAEIDAAFVQKLQGKCSLIPVRSSLAVTELPPLLAALHSPSIDDYESAVPSLIADLYGANKKPQKGPPPSFTRSLLAPECGLSEAARQVALLLLSRSEHGRSKDPTLEVSFLTTETQLPADSLADAVFELEELGLVEPRRHLGAGPHGFSAVATTNHLFAALDQFAMSWNPEKDALRLASRLLSTPGADAVVQVLAQELCWSTRRINPALTYLEENDLVNASQEISFPYVCASILCNERTSRWLKQNS